MIDRESRDTLAEALRQYTSGRITNYNLDEINIRFSDNGVHAVKQAAWGLYDDLHKHKAIEDYYLDTSDKHEIARWILFLQTNNEYLWEPFTIKDGLLSLITLGYYSKKFYDKIDNTIWPFKTPADLDKALQNPNLLKP